MRLFCAAGGWLAEGACFAGAPRPCTPAKGPMALWKPNPAGWADGTHLPSPAGSMEHAVRTLPLIFQPLTFPGGCHIMRWIPKTVDREEYQPLSFLREPPRVGRRQGKAGNGPGRAGRKWPDAPRVMGKSWAGGSLSIWVVPQAEPVPCVGRAFIFLRAGFSRRKGANIWNISFLTG